MVERRDFLGTVFKKSTELNVHKGRWEEWETESVRERERERERKDKWIDKQIDR